MGLAETVTLNGLDEFAAELESKAAANTRETYLRDVARFVAAMEGQPLTFRTVKGYLDSLKKTNGEKLNPQTVVRAYAAIVRYLGWRAAVLEDETCAKALATMQAYSPCPRVGARKDQTMMSREQYEKALGRIADPKDFRRLYACNPERDSALLHLLWYTGVRVSELVSLTKAQGMELTTQGYTRIVGKGDKPRNIVLPVKARALLRPYVEGLKGKLLFPSPQGGEKHLEVRKIQRLLENLELPHPHSARHAYRARARRAKVSDQVIQNLLGHAASGVTDEYGAPNVDELLQAAEAIQ